MLKETTDRWQKMRELKEVKFKRILTKEVKTVGESSYHKVQCITS